MSANEQTTQLPDLVDVKLTEPKPKTNKRKRVVDEEEATTAKRTYKKKKVSAVIENNINTAGNVNCSNYIFSENCSGFEMTGVEFTIPAKNLRWFSFDQPVVITKRVMCYESSDSSSFSDSE